MNRKELVDAIQQQTGVTRAEVDKVLGSFIEQTSVAVKKGTNVSLVGFGVFERRDRKARTARNPRTGTPVRVKATKVPAFRAGQAFKDVVAGKKTAPKLAAARTTSRSTTARATSRRAAAKPATRARATAKPAARRSAPARGRRK